MPGRVSILAFLEFIVEIHAVPQFSSNGSIFRETTGFEPCFHRPDSGIHRRHAVVMSLNLILKSGCPIEEPTFIAKRHLDIRRLDFLTAALKRDFLFLPLRGAFVESRSWREYPSSSINAFNSGPISSNRL